MAKIHVSISAEPIFHLGNIEITNSMITGIVISILLIIFSLQTYKKLQNDRRPKAIQNIIEMIFEGLFKFMSDIAGDQKTKEFFPVIATLLIYILLCNWSGLLPGVGTIGIKETTAVESIEPTKSEGYTSQQVIETEEIIPVEDGKVIDQAGEIIESPTEKNIIEESKKEKTETKESFVPIIRPPSADLNFTLALSIISMVGVQIVGIKHLKLSYFKKFIDLRGPMQFVVGLLEIISEVSRLISFSFRLFGNIFAGEVLLTVILALLPFLAPLPFLGLEVFVGAIQAVVFAGLTLIFWNMATIGHTDNHED